MLCEARTSLGCRHISRSLEVTWFTRSWWKLLVIRWSLCMYAQPFKTFCISFSTQTREMIASVLVIADVTCNFFLRLFPIVFILSAHTRRENVSFSSEHCLLDFRLDGLMAINCCLVEIVNVHAGRRRLASGDHWTWSPTRTEILKFHFSYFFLYQRWQ